MSAAHLFEVAWDEYNATSWWHLLKRYSLHGAVMFCLGEWLEENKRERLQRLTRILEERPQAAARHTGECE